MTLLYKSIGDCNKKVSREGKKKVSLKIYENDGQMYLIDKTPKNSSVAMRRDRHSVLPAQSSSISSRQMYWKVGKYQTKQQQRVKKNHWMPWTKRENGGNKWSR